MDKMTFLRDLDNALSGEVSDYVKNDTMNYYNQYIVDEVNTGKSEDEVIRSLGSGNIIAKTVIEAEKAKQGGSAEYEYQENYSSYYGAEQTGQKKQKGFHMDTDADGNMKLKYGAFTLNSWYGKLIGILLLILVGVLFIALVAGVFSLLWYILPIILILMFVTWLMRFISR